MAELDSVAASLLSPEELEAIQGGEYSDDEIEALFEYDPFEGKRAW